MGGCQQSVCAVAGRSMRGQHSTRPGGVQARRALETGLPCSRVGRTGVLESGRHAWSGRRHPPPRAAAAAAAPTSQQAIRQTTQRATHPNPPRNPPAHPPPSPPALLPPPTPAPRLMSTTATPGGRGRGTQEKVGCGWGGSSAGAGGRHTRVGVGRRQEEQGGHPGHPATPNRHPPSHPPQILSAKGYSISLEGVYEA